MGREDWWKESARAVDEVIYPSLVVVPFVSPVTSWPSQSKGCQDRLVLAATLCLALRLGEVREAYSGRRRLVVYGNGNCVQAGFISSV